MLQPFSPAAEPPWQRRPLRVPADDEALLSVPPVAAAWEPARAKADALDASEVNVQGRTLARLRAWTRELALAAAAKYERATFGAREPGTADAMPVRGPLFATGHQPSLFHPGVWAKNFAAHALARAAGGTALNLIIDNDVVATRRIRVPAGNATDPRVETVPFDEPRPAQPWEDAEIGDREVFEAFGPAIVERMGAWGIVPLAEEGWAAALAATSQGAGLRDALTSVRVGIERRWGVRNLELPLSRLCESDAFGWFAAHVLAHLPRFQEVHNTVLAEFRQANRIRSRTHPVPELVSDGPWREAPFWVWRTGEPRRKRVFARQAGRKVELHDGDEVFCALRLRPDMDGCCAVEDLRELPARGLRFRTRALTTTLFARLCLADQFVHGIGGAKYDEMTDRIIARFFGVPAPEFLTLSATLRLPLGAPVMTATNDVGRLRRRLVDLEHNADRFLESGNDPEVAVLAREKQRLIGEQARARAAAAGLSRRERRNRSRENHTRFLRLREVNAALAACAAGERRRVEAELAAAERQEAATAVLTDREYSFCLYPEAKLRSFLTHLIQGGKNVGSAANLSDSVSV